MMARAWRINPPWTTRRIRNLKKRLLKRRPRCLRLVAVRLPSGPYLRLADLAAVIIRSIRSIRR